MSIKKFLKSFLLLFFSIDLFLITTFTASMDVYAQAALTSVSAAKSDTYISAPLHTKNLDSLSDRKGQASNPVESIKGMYDSLPSQVKKGAEAYIGKKGGEALDSLGALAYGMGRSYMNEGKQLIAQGTKLAKKSATALETAAKAKTMAGTSKNARQLYYSAMKQGKKLATDSANKLSTGKALRGGGAMLRAAGAAVAALGVAGDISDLNNPTKNQRKPLAALERGLTWADLLLAGGALILFVGGAPVTGTVATVTGVIGLAKAVLTSDTFTKWANKKDNSIMNELDELVDSIGGARKTPEGVNALKPNIYIYNADGKLIRVRFTEPELLTKSIPNYNGVWLVNALGNESLLATEDGTEYGFLFYESLTEKFLFETKNGFRISKANRCTEWNRILSEYGFNETEIADFVDFWDVKLEDKDYIMYPQYTDTIDIAMPIEIDPVPANIIRMWFAFETDDGQENVEPEIESFTHDGYTVVEWGGMIFD